MLAARIGKACLPRRSLVLGTGSCCEMDDTYTANTGTVTADTLRIEV